MPLGKVIKKNTIKKKDTKVPKKNGPNPAVEARPQPKRGKSYSDEDASLIKYCHEKHSWGAPRIAREHPGKGWSVSGVKKILQKVKKGASPGRKAGSGGHNKNRTAAAIARVAHHLERGQGKTASGATVRKISSKLLAEGVKLSREGVRRAIRLDLRKKSMAQVSAHRISAKNAQKRLDFCKKTLKAIGAGSLDLGRIVFSDETMIRCSDTVVNSRVNRVWVDKNLARKDADPELITKPTSGFSEGVMVHLCVSKLGFLPAAFCDPKCKVNQEKYIELLTLDVVPNIRELTDDLGTITWQEDNATAHSGKQARSYTKSKFPKMLEWPPQSPDLSPLDYSVNDYVKTKVRGMLPAVAKPDDVRAAIKKVWREMPRAYVGKVIDHFPKRLQLCIDAGGAHFECKM